MDICSDGKIIDHAAYYDHASVVKQMKPAKGESGAPAVGRLSPSDSGLQPKVEAEREAQAQLAQLYAGKVLSMLDNCCHGVGLGVCVAAEELRVAACSSDFAMPLGFADKHSALGSGLIAHLRSRAVPLTTTLARVPSPFSSPPPSSPPSPHRLPLPLPPPPSTPPPTPYNLHPRRPRPRRPHPAARTPTTFNPAARTPAASTPATRTPAARTTRCPGTTRRRRPSTAYASPRASGALIAPCSWCARR